MIGRFSQKTAYRLTRRAALFFLTPLLLYSGKVFGSEKQKKAVESIEINSKASLVHLGSLDSFDITESGTKAAKLLLQSLEEKQTESASDARQIYNQIIPKENYGGEYTALQWFSEYLLASPQQQKQMLAEPFILEFFNFFADNDFAVLKEYLNRKYKLKKLADEETLTGKDRKAFLEDFILFNNPRRENWEKTSKIIQSLNLQKGERIADIGSGPGYYTFKFAELVGSQGLVFAIDTVQEHLNYVKNISQKQGIKNIQTVKNKSNNISLPPQQVDIAFMCSLYHVIYVTSTEESREQFVESIKIALKPGGTLVIIDNALVQTSTLPYHGPYIAKELIVGQLHYYGFRLVDEYAFIPQRYVLVFKIV